ncbi:MAG: hypothetical protein RL095_454 [Verrucomicrobiota bacterium]|jgi:hypothetical protein
MVVESEIRQQFIQFQKTVFDINDILIFKLEFDQVIESRVLYIFLRSKVEPIVFVDHAEQFYIFLETLVCAVDVNKQVLQFQDKTKVEKASSVGPVPSKEEADGEDYEEEEDLDALLNAKSTREF